MDRVRNGGRPWVKLDVLHRMSLNDILRQFNVEGLSENEIEDFNRIWHRLEPWPDSVAGLERLKKRFVITTLSNGNVSLLTNMAKHASLPWDCILSAEFVRRYKPDPGTYFMVPELFDLHPVQVMMVAAHEHDLQAAQKHGLRTAYVRRPREHGPSLPPPGRYDFVAKHFLELADKIEV